MNSPRAQSIGFGVLLTTLVTFSTRILSAVVNLGVVYLLAPEEFGLFVGIQAIVFMGVGFCDLGLSHAYRQKVSRDNGLDVQLMGASIIIQGIAVLIYFVGVIIYLQSENMLSTAAIVIALGALATQLPEITAIDLNINRKFTWLSIVKFLPVAGMCIGLLLAFFVEDKLLGLASGYLLGSIAAIVVSVKMVGLSKISMRFGAENIDQMKLGVPFLTSILMYRTGQYFGVVYVLSMEGAYMAGILGLSLKIYQMMLMATTTSTSVILPYLHKLSSDDNLSHIGVVTKKLIGPIWVITSCLAGVVIIGATDIVAFIGRDQYGEAAELLRVFGLAFIFKSLSIPAGNILEGRGLQWVRVSIQATATLIIVASTIILYPEYGVNIVVYSVLIADVISFFLLWGINAYGMKNFLPWGVHLKAVIIVVVGLALSELIDANEALVISVFVLYVLASSTFIKVWDVKQIIKYLK